MDDSVARLHRAIAGAIKETRGEDFDQPVTVSEIYQVLMPYRTARSLVGFEMNADYEYALLRLLAGEDDLARIEPAEARELLRGELESANPNVSAYRGFANCDVWIAAPGQSASELAAQYEREAPPEVEAAEELADEPAAPVPEPIVERRSELPPPPVPAAAPRARACPSCGGRLPAGRTTNYCPFCGHDLARGACPSCGETLDPAWRFCANCGRQVESANAEAN